MYTSKKPMNSTKPKISIILPCRNEEIALPFCIKKIKNIINQENLNAEIIVSDSSTDNSFQIAQNLNVLVIKHDKNGYGNAYKEAFKIAQGDILILGDADDTYDFSEIPNLLRFIPEYDLVLGQRKYLVKGSMPVLNRYIGNPTLSFILSILFKVKIKDCHTGFRVIKKTTLQKLNLQSTGMEFASEMIISAVKNKVKIKETPIHYYPRKGETKLRRIPDGLRHIYLIFYSFLSSKV
jgi:glycosyltransferase involved in cell wall biosynthesis